MAGPGGKLPLSRLTVLDLTHARAGPTAARQLADWGANVVKIEPPATEADKEGLTGNRHNPDFQNLHRNKRSITLNLKAAEGREIFLKMAETADVVVENYRAQVKHRLGIDYAAVRARNPRIVYGSISGFGQDGPIGHRAGVDQIAQGMGGLMSITGLPGQGPVRVGIPIADLTAGMFLAQGILLALMEREQSGEGQWVHTSLLEAQIAMLDFQAARWLIGKEVPKQAGNDHPTGIPTGVFPTKDGAVNIASSGQRLYERFCRAIDAPDLLENPDYRTGELRSRNRAALNAAIAERTRRYTSAELIQMMDEAGVPCGPINTIDQVFAEPQVRHLGIAQPVEHPTLGSYEVVGQAVHLTRTPSSIRRATPERGEHTEEVLAAYGYDREAVARLRAAGVV
jgi:formyl-CoA transferase